MHVVIDELNILNSDERTLKVQPNTRGTRTGGEAKGSSWHGEGSTHRVVVDCC